MAVTIKPRSEIDPAHTWNAESLFASREAWRAEYAALDTDLTQADAFRGRLGTGAAVLADFMELSDDLNRRAGFLLVYAGMAQAVDSGDPEAVGMLGQVFGLLAKVGAALAFSTPELLTIGHDTLRGWVAGEARLSHLGQFVDNLFRLQEHTRSAEVEELLGLASDALGQDFQNWQMLTAADMKFEDASDSRGEKLPVTQGTMPALMSNPDRAARRTAWLTYTDAHLAHKNVLASNLTMGVKRDVFMARARHFKTALDAALHPINVPTAVFHNLIETYRQNLPTWHRYWRIRRKALGVETLHPYDVWAPLGSVQPVVPFAQAVDWISAALRPLGDEYVNALRRGCLEQRWVDLYPNVGKTQGAFSSGVRGTYPFIMMSYHDDLQAMSTLAHELGHSMHSYLTWQHQPETYSQYALFVAEVASNFNQAMTRAYLFEHNTDRDFQIALLEEALYNFHRYFFTMPTLARFEYEFHTRIEQGKPVTAEDLLALMADLYEEGYGGEMQVDRERVGITWATYPHMYQGYYVFQYATGISAANALAARIHAGEAGAAERYVQFLSTGSALYPLDALKLAGVDMTTPRVVEEAFGVLAGLVDRLEALVG